jgi:hypothetical protein
MGGPASGELPLEEPPSVTEPPDEPLPDDVPDDDPLAEPPLEPPLVDPVPLEPLPELPPDDEPEGPPPDDPPLDDVSPPTPEVPPHAGTAMPKASIPRATATKGRLRAPRAIVESSSRSPRTTSCGASPARRVRRTYQPRRVVDFALQVPAALQPSARTCSSGNLRSSSYRNRCP